ncbi:MAG: DNA-directed RNA polymerase subunit omega [Melioribacteraceae bacterium]|nr:DNA-directed RNA polymerase subunit omega [Melioribacteraceae bacterium]MCF8412990.1 DNA-directed RNA polymerase subunit omega [Melioribacteraceae bacterium]MCF8431349.1 DNA-directed RNA polymerase subunit omega [Melioribacteraceae bacterium]
MDGFRPVNLETVEKNTNNIYEAVIVASKRARNINDQNRMEYNAQLNMLIPDTEDEFDDRLNPDQERLSVEFELKPKAHIQALSELIETGIKYRFREQQIEEE